MKPILYLAVFIIFYCNNSFAQSSKIITVAGNGTAGYSGDGGPAISGVINNPWGIHTDNNGNIYFVEFLNSVIRKVSKSGIISTIAGNGIPGYSGDGGPATAAMLEQYPEGLAIDTFGNVFICDHNSNRIRKVDVSGIISTVAGNGVLGYSGDGGPATSAAFHYPSDVAVDLAGNIYVADEFNQVIRKINTAGIITTVAGTGIGGYSGDGGPATNAKIHQPMGVMADNEGNIYICDQLNSCIRKINSSGVISTFAGIGGSDGFSGDGGPAIAAELHYPTRTAIDTLGNIYIADLYNNVVRKVNPSGIISTIVGIGTGFGTGIGAYSGDFGPATASELSGPVGVAVDLHGNIFVSDASNNRIRKILALPSASIGTFSNLICLDSCVTLINTSLGDVDSIFWSTTSTTISTPYNDTINVCFHSSGIDTISLYVYNISGVDSIFSTIIVNSRPNPKITLSGHTLSVSSSYGSYQWYEGTTLITGATNNSFTYTIPNTYKVVVDSMGCFGVSDTFLSLDVNLSSINTFDINLKPNPNTGSFSLTGNVNLQNEIVQVQVFNILGQSIYSDNFTIHNGLMDFDIKLNRHTPSGVYMLNLSSPIINYFSRFLVENK